MGLVGSSASRSTTASGLRVAFGGDYYVLAGEPDPVLAGELSLVWGDGRGVDFEARWSTIFVLSFIELGPRIYLSDDWLKPYVSAGVGTGLILFVPTDLVVSAGGGLQIGKHLEIGASAFVIQGGTMADEVDRGARGSFAIRF